MPPTVLLSAAGGRGDDLRELLTGAGFAVRGHALGATATVDLSGVAAAVVEADPLEAAAAQTRRWRAELGDRFVPVVWVLPDAEPERAARGLDAGADAVLARPLTPAVFAAQVRAAVRSSAGVRRTAARAAEARLLGEQLDRAIAQAARELDAARRIRLALLPRSLPDVGPVRFAVSHRPRSTPGSDFHAVRRIDGGRVVFCVGDVTGAGGAGSLLGRFVVESVLGVAEEVASAGELLTGVNRRLLALDLEDRPLVALGVGLLDADTGRLTLARAGLPAPVWVPATGPVETVAVPGPFPGVAEATYPSHAAVLGPGDKLLLCTDGVRPDGTPGPADDSPVRESAHRARERAGQRFVDAVAAELLAQVRHEDDVTLLCVGGEGVERPTAGDL